MGEVIAFISIKGGVGKTTLSLETASSLANDFGKKVLVIDANFSAPNIDLYSGLSPEMTLHDVLSGNIENAINAIHEKHNFDLLPAALYYKKAIDTLKLKEVVEKLRERYDFIILDSSPNFLELIPVIISSNRIFIVTTPDHQTLMTSIKAAKLARVKKTPIEGIIINKIRNPIYELDLKEVENMSDIPVVARIKDDKVMSESLFYRKPITLHKKAHPISKEIKRFASAVCGEPEKVRWFMRNFSKEKVNREIMRQAFYERMFK